MLHSFSDPLDASSSSIASVDVKFNPLNGYSKTTTTFHVGVSEDKGTRRTMEDAHSIVTDFDSIRGQGFFAVFDGHAGRHAAEWCGENFHECLLAALSTSTSRPVPDLFNETFHSVDETLSRMCEDSEGKLHSGCTAVTAFLRMEDAEGRQRFLRDSQPKAPLEQELSNSHNSSGSRIDEVGGIEPPASPGSSQIKAEIKNPGVFSSTLCSAVSPSLPLYRAHIVSPPPLCRRVLYTANAGDARAVLCRSGKAIRLTYDHKGSDKREAKRITDAGGFVMSGRVNGVLAVTRSLGDSSMKEFVVGSPYTTETELSDDDEFLVLACDGLWDVIKDQNAIDLVREIHDAQKASAKLLKHALTNHTTDNVTVVVVRFKPTSLNTS